MAAQPGNRADPLVVIASRSHAGGILCSPKERQPFAFLASIGGAMDRVPAGMRNIDVRVRLVFEDVVSQEEGGPSVEDVERLLRFARRVDFSKGGLLSHCESGISRSSAASR